MNRIVYSGAIALVLAAGCSSSTAATDGGTTTDAATRGQRAANGECPSTSSTCTQAEHDAYVSCLTTQCNAEYQECLGPNYQSGTWGGKCATYMTCTTACDCDDSACKQACGAPQGDCTTCFVALGKCTLSKCTIPKCMGTGVGSTDAGTTKTCADLKTCCDSIVDSTKKAGCDAAYNAVKGVGDIACNASYQSQVAQGNCK